MYWLFLAFLLGFIFAFLSRHPFMLVVRKFKSRAPLVRQYWIVVIPFLLLTTVGYVWVYIYANDSINIEILGQASALIFAVFVGYIAFAEWSKTKFDDLVAKGRGNSEQGRFMAAMTNMEDAHRLQPKDIRVLGDLLELYLINEEVNKFDQKIDHYKATIIEKPDNLKYYFLLASRYLLSENLKDAKSVIKLSIDFVSKNNDLRPKFGWRIMELKNSEIYKKLSKSTQTMLENFHAYLGGNLSEAREVSFLQGTYDTQTE